MRSVRCSADRACPEPPTFLVLLLCTDSAPEARRANGNARHVATERKQRAEAHPECVGGDRSGRLFRRGAGHGPLMHTKGAIFAEPTVITRDDWSGRGEDDERFFLVMFSPGSQPSPRTTVTARAVGSAGHWSLPANVPLSSEYTGAGGIT